jgi:superfamily II RNA helicase
MVFADRAPEPSCRRRAPVGPAVPDGCRSTQLGATKATPHPFISLRSTRTLSCDGMAIGRGPTDRSHLLSAAPKRRAVRKLIVDLHERGALRSLLEANPDVLGTAIALGEEWLGANSAILKCLRLGVALQHGALPTAYRREIERLLRDNVLKVTISSPPLAQGLNLSATAVAMHSLHRSGERIDISEFKNVIGRAGRAYVDVEGIVLFPMFDDIARKRRS